MPNLDRIVVVPCRAGPPAVCTASVARASEAADHADEIVGSRHADEADVRRMRQRRGRLLWRAAAWE
eukprot:1581302-Prymnesium_polylepis.1